MRYLLVGAGLICLLALAFCWNSGSSDDNVKKQAQYEAGYDDGLSDGEAETCDRIKRFSSSISDSLVNAQICPKSN